MNSPHLTLLYDGACPFCRREVDWMRSRNRDLRLRFEDISSPSFSPEKYGLSHEQVNRSIHAVRDDGTVIRGVDVFVEVYRLLGLGWMVAPLTLPVVRPVADAGYRVFARYRVMLGKLFGRDSCSSDACTHA
ncbi:MAG: thiol-disulfide oxidoreductase DCC family protein [Planctomycetota bacterium]